jgi:hypothetical protein
MFSNTFRNVLIRQLRSLSISFGRLSRSVGAVRLGFLKINYKLFPVVSKDWSLNLNYELNSIFTTFVHSCRPFAFSANSTVILNKFFPRVAFILNLEVFRETRFNFRINRSKRWYCWSTTISIHTLQ